MLFVVFGDLFSSLVLWLYCMNKLMLKANFCSYSWCPKIAQLSTFKMLILSLKVQNNYFLYSKYKISAKTEHFKYIMEVYKVY